MSLKELLIMNGLVFGVEEPKIIASTKLTLSSLNLENKFVFTGLSSCVIRFSYYVNGTLNAYTLVFSDYINLDDLFKNLNLVNSGNTIIDLNVLSIVLDTFSQFDCLEGSLEGTFSYQKEEGEIFYNKYPIYTLDSGGFPRYSQCRFYLIEYDQTKLMRI